LDALNPLRAHWRFSGCCFGAFACLCDSVRFPVDGFAVERIREVLRDLLLLLRLRHTVGGVRDGQAVVLHGKEPDHEREQERRDG
jgi:hypothetical protein